MPDFDSSYPPARIQQRLLRQPRRVFSGDKNLLRAFWVCVVLYNEKVAFWRALRHCHWPGGWPDAYRVAIISDPQIVDANTYQRSPPLLAATKLVTDLYLRRNYRLLHKHFRPQHIIFLGDLMDGGREWDDETWLAEYERFMRIFPPFHDTTVVYSLPGNHDVGFGNGVKPEVLDRFHKYFGDEQVFDIGNHTAIMLDTLSLSNSEDRRTWNGARQLLDSLDTGRPGAGLEPTRESKRLPRIIFTHVPFYRSPDKRCGSLRQSAKGIQNLKGYQYQNMVESALSDEILGRIRPAVIFSGDDHDSCEVIHDYIDPAGNGQRLHAEEHTIVSFSMAMGISKPGFQLLSLHNPDGVEPAPAGSATFATETCFMPQQMYIYTTYLVCLLFTLVFAAFRVQKTARVVIKGKYRSLPLSRYDNNGSVDRGAADTAWVPWLTRYWGTCIRTRLFVQYVGEVSYVALPVFAVFWLQFL